MTAPVHGFVDAGGLLVAADPPLAGLHARAGGDAGGALAIPALAAVARLARRLGIAISRGVVAADGETDIDLWVRATPEGAGVHLALVDWTERMAAIPAAPLDEARRHDVGRALADWRWQADAGFRLTALSDGAPPSRGLIGQPLTRLFAFVTHPDGTLPVVEAMAEQRGFEAQLAELRGAGSGDRVWLGAAPLTGADGRFAGFCGTATALVPSAAADVAPADAGNAAIARLGDALRGPLDRIIAQAETIRLQNEGPIRRDYAGYAADIAAAGRHLLGLVTDLLDLAAMERADFAVAADAVDLADIARRAAGLLALRAAAGGVEIDAPGPEEAVPARGDFGRCLQIAVNLIGNAIRYSPPGAAVRIAAAADAGVARLAVTDAGKGVAPADQARIFGKFERVDPAEPGTTGLGLYISRRLARAMGGDIAVASAAGAGACFTLALPRDDGGAA